MSTSAVSERVTVEFKHFTDDIWERILDYLDDTEDIANIFLACPRIKNLSHGRQFSWLVGQAMRHIFPKYLKMKDIKNCRCVSKRWRNAVSNILQTHPDGLPYKSVQRSELPEIHFNYRKLPEVPINVAAFTNYVSSKTKISFTENPFPGRSAHLSVKSADGDENEYRRFRGSVYVPLPMKADLLQAVPIFQKFGHNIWYLTVEATCIKSVSSEYIINKILKPLFECLSLLPNLKSLDITRFPLRLTDMSKDGISEIVEFISSRTYPFQLETLKLLKIHYAEDFSEIYSSLIRTLANHQELKYLVTYTNNWRSEYAALFPNLCHLRLRMSGWIYPNPDKATLRNILHDLRLSPLRKLQIVAKGMYVGDILDTLVQYKIESLDLVGEIREHGQISKQQSRKSICSFLSRRMTPINCIKVNIAPENCACVAVLSIIHLKLKLQRNCIWFEFLKSLPFLQYLSIEIIHGGWFLYHVEEWKKYIVPSNGLYMALHDFCYADLHKADHFQFIWEDLPNLKMLTLVKNGTMYQYVRECKRTLFCSNRS